MDRAAVDRRCEARYHYQRTQQSMKTLLSFTSHHCCMLRLIASRIAASSSIPALPIAALPPPGMPFGGPLVPAAAAVAARRSLSAASIAAALSTTARLVSVMRGLLSRGHLRGPIAPANGVLGTRAGAEKARTSHPAQAFHPC